MKNVSIMKHSLLPLLLLSFSLFDLAVSTPSDSPLKIKINSDLIKTVIHKRDEEFLDLFKDMSLGDFNLDVLEESEELRLKQMNVSFLPMQGEMHEYDHYVSLNQDDFIGIECRNLKFKGTGVLYHGDVKLNGESFEYEGPVDKLRLTFEFRDSAET
jgi:hypothetical protein